MPTQGRILTIMVRHGEGLFHEAFLALRQTHHASIAKVWDIDYLVVDNALDEEDEAHATPLRLNDVEVDRATLIAGDNTLREFSGLQRGLDHAGPRLAGYDLVNLVTETFHFDYTYYLYQTTPAMLALAAEHGLALGHLDGYPEPVAFLGLNSRFWLRTCYVFLPPRALESVGGVLTTDGADFFRESYEPSPFRENAPLDDVYREYITSWLTGDGAKAYDNWDYRNQFTLDQHSLAKFQAKATAILNEHGLSARLRAAGYPTVDVEWLAHLLLTRQTPDFATPPEAMTATAATLRHDLGVPDP